MFVNKTESETWNPKNYKQEVQTEPNLQFFIAKAVLKPTFFISGKMSW